MKLQQTSLLVLAGCGPAAASSLFLGAAPGGAAAPGPGPEAPSGPAFIAGSPAGPAFDDFANELVDQAMRPGEDSFKDACGKDGCPDGCMRFAHYQNYCRKVADPGQAHVRVKHAPSFAYKCLKDSKKETPYHFEFDEGLTCEEHCTVFAEAEGSAEDKCLCEAAYLGVNKSKDEHDGDCLKGPSFERIAKGMDIWGTAANYVIKSRSARLVQDFDELDTNHDGVIDVAEGAKQGRFGESPLHVCADVNGDGKVTRQEFAASEGARRGGVATCSQLEETIIEQCHSLDTNGDGKICFSEWNKMSTASFLQAHSSRNSTFASFVDPDDTLAPECADADEDGTISFHECAKLGDSRGTMMRAIMCDSCSHWQKVLPSAKSNTELKADEAATCLAEDEVPCYTPVMSHASFVCADSNNDNLLTREECTKAGAQQDEFAAAPKHDMAKLKEWVDHYYLSEHKDWLEKVESDAKKAAREAEKAAKRAAEQAKRDQAKAKGLVTTDGCECAEKWVDAASGYTCDDYCCNPDQDVKGVWCFKVDPTCGDLGLSWGTCEYQPLPPCWSTVAAPGPGPSPGPVPCFDGPGPGPAPGPWLPGPAPAPGPAPCPGPGPCPAPGPAPMPSRPESFLECMDRVTNAAPVWPGGLVVTDPKLVKAQRDAYTIEVPEAPAGAPGAAPGAPGSPAPSAPKPKPVLPHVHRPEMLPNIMDKSGDGKVSWQEAYDYAIDMPGVDVRSTLVDELFHHADVNGNKYLDPKEYFHGGKHFKGDGQGQL
jgi:Ca2+-binding EF-hand superfamily protein